jgi:hypothetical protein
MIFGAPTFAVYLVGAIALAASAGGLWIHGHRSGADAVLAEVDAARVAQAEAAMVKLNEEITRGNEISRRLEESQRRVRQLVRARSADLDSLHSCGNVPAAFVRVLDDAAASRVSSAAETPGESSCSASTVTTAQAAGIIASNYDTCNQQAAQLGLLIDWVEGKQ